MENASARKDEGFPERDSGPKTGVAIYSAIYGKVRVLRGHCYSCDTDVWLHGEEFSCCGRKVRAKPGKKVGSRRMLETGGIRRRKPSPARQHQLLEQQQNRCLYCQCRFGDFVIYRDRLVELKVRWDHFVPFNYAQNNSDMNFVAACQRCNGIKTNRHFNNVTEVREWVIPRLNLRSGCEDQICLEDMTEPDV